MRRCVGQPNVRLWGLGRYVRLVLSDLGMTPGRSLIVGSLVRYQLGKGGRSLRGILLRLRRCHWSSGLIRCRSLRGILLRLLCRRPIRFLPRRRLGGWRIVLIRLLLRSRGRCRRRA